jgi:hypothetical protein
MSMDGSEPRRDTIDIWRCAIVRRSIDSLGQEEIKSNELVWLPPTRSYAFRADPFALWRGGKLHIFVENFDYREMVGRIELLVYDESLRFLENRIVLAEPWHLSCPFVFQADGETWMLPEARQSWTLRLYRARSFPDDWEEVYKIEIDAGAVDATPLWYRDRWWLFYSVMRHRPDRYSQLHVAWSERLTGPWHRHPGNPVRVGVSSTRPGGTPLVYGERIDLPVQDCRKTYGGAVRRLSITHLDDKGFEAFDTPWVEPSPSFAPCVDGIHTLAAAGPVTIVDCKRLDSSWYGLALRRFGLARRKLARWRSPVPT